MINNLLELAFASGVPVGTAESVQDRALNAGWPEAAAELAVRATARERHALRVHRTIDAALAVVRPGLRPDLPRLVEMVSNEPSMVEEDDREACHDAAIILLLDMNGVGGPYGGGRQCGDCRTHRIPGFAGLGSGRWHASDGEAYRAAAFEALTRLANAALCGLALECHVCHGGVFLGLYCANPHWLIPLTAGMLPLEHVAAYARGQCALSAQSGRFDESAPWAKCMVLAEALVEPEPCS